MTLGRVSTSTPLDDFLAGAGSQTHTGELVQRIGLIGSLIGITLATGLVVFLAAVHRGRNSEVRLILGVVVGAGFLTVIGAATRVAGIASVLDIGWFDALSSGSGSAAMMSLLAGILIAFGLYAHTVPVDRPGGALVELRQTAGAAAPDPDLPATDAAVEISDAGPHTDVVDEIMLANVAGRRARSELPDDHVADDDQIVRWVPSAASAFGLGGIVTGVMSFGFDGHTVTAGPRAVHTLVDVVHVTAGSIWFGGVVALAIVSYLRRRSGESTASLMVRFSGVATVAVIATALAGALMSLMITDGFGEYTGTDWGRILILKTAIVAIVAVIGGYNHFVVVPALDRDPGDASMVGRARATITLEGVLLLCAAVTTVFLTTASTN